MSAADEAIEQRAELLKAGTIIRYCNYCGCQIDDQRRARKSPYCSVEHRRLAVNEKRELRSHRACRLCGKRKRSTAGSKQKKALLR